MASTFFEIDCGQDEPIVMEVQLWTGKITFHGWDCDDELAAMELGFDPSPGFIESTCFIVWDAARREELEDRLIQFAGQGRVDVVETLIAAGAELRDSIDDALVAAAASGNTATVTLLLEHGPDVHAWNDMALSVAAEYGHTDVVDILKAWIEEHG